MKFYLIILFSIFLQGCLPHSASVIGSSIALVTTNNAPRVLLSKGTDALIKQKTGKNTLDHIVSSTYFEEDLRDCEKYNSTELNKIFFDTLDQIDCKSKN